MPALTETAEEPWWKRAVGALSAGATGGMPQSQPQQQGPALGQTAEPAPVAAPPPAPAAQTEVQKPAQPPAKQGIEIAQESVEAVKTASANDKKEINKALEEQLGGPKGLQAAYDDAIERLGGLKTFDPKMKREDWGLFIMDFGLRMMAASSDQNWNQDAVGAMGEAGIGAIGALRERQTSERGFVQDYNEQLRSEAKGLAEMQMPTKDNIIWTDQGAYNIGTGDFQRDPSGGVLQPGMAPGASNRPLQRQMSEDALVASGLDPSVAKRIAHSSSPGIEELQHEYGLLFDKMMSQANDFSMVPGSNVDWETLKQDPQKLWQVRQQFVKQRVSSIYGGALQEPGPQAEGRGRPNTWDTY